MLMSSNYVWTPVGADSTELEEFLSLRPGIPDYMRESVIGWIRDGKYNHEYSDLEFLRRFQNTAKMNLGIKASRRSTYDNLSEFLSKLDQVKFINLIHFMLSEINVPPNGRTHHRAEALEKTLATGGASYKVGMVGGRYGLIERVPAAVAQTVEEVISSSGKASELLSKAWEMAFGINKSPSHAYSNAVKATEVFSCRLFSPNDKSATLGKDIHVLRSGEKNFQFVMQGSRNNTSTHHLLSMMELLWHSQTDRHGEEDYSNVTVEEAQAAVLLASTLVGWFSQGLVSRINS